MLLSVTRGVMLPMTDCRRMSSERWVRLECSSSGRPQAATTHNEADSGHSERKAFHNAAKYETCVLRPVRCRLGCRASRHRRLLRGQPDAQGVRQERRRPYDEGVPNGGRRGGCLDLGTLLAQRSNDLTRFHPERWLESLSFRRCTPCLFQSRCMMSRCNDIAC